MAGRSSIYETADGLEIEANEQYETLQRRVLFEDVVLVTFHRETGWPYVLAHGAIALVFLLIAGLLFAAAAPLGVTLLFTALGAPSLALLIVRMIVKVDVVTVFGRRSKAVIRFPWHKRRAREVYGRICARTRQVQAQIAAGQRDEATPASESIAPPLPPEPALP
jgi:hypothetical protein